MKGNDQNKLTQTGNKRAKVTTFVQCSLCFHFTFCICFSFNIFTHITVTTWACFVSVLYSNLIETFHRLSEKLSPHNSNAFQMSCPLVQMHLVLVSSSNLLDEHSTTSRYRLQKASKLQKQTT